MSAKSIFAGAATLVASAVSISTFASSLDAPNRYYHCVYGLKRGQQTINSIETAVQPSSGEIGYKGTLLTEYRGKNLSSNNFDVTELEVQGRLDGLRSDSEANAQLTLVRDTFVFNKKHTSEPLCSVNLNGEGETSCEVGDYTFSLQCGYVDRAEWLRIEFSGGMNYKFRNWGVNLSLDAPGLSKSKAASLKQSAMKTLKKMNYAIGSSRLRFMDADLSVDSKGLGCSATLKAFAPWDPNITPETTAWALTCKTAILRLLRDLPTKTALPEAFREETLPK